MFRARPACTEAGVGYGKVVRGHGWLNSIEHVEAEKLGSGLRSWGGFPRRGRFGEVGPSP